MLAPLAVSVVELPEQMVVFVGLTDITGGGTGLTEKQLAALVPQALDAVTQIFPELSPKLTESVLVPWPDKIVAPAGTVHE